MQENKTLISGGVTDPLRQRLTAHMEGDFVVFLLGLRLNQPWQVHRWWPMYALLHPMLRQLKDRPETGFLHGEIWYGRTILSVQYWRSWEALQAFAHDKQSLHVPAWKEFNRQIGLRGEMGIFHETYLVKAGNYENIYHNMPRFGLGVPGTLSDTRGRYATAKARLENRPLEPLAEPGLEQELYPGEEEP
jgi:hypothetical protein